MSIAYRRACQKAKKLGKKPPSPKAWVKIMCSLEEKRTKQSEAESCDINKIMARYINTGRLPDYIKDNPTYGDFSEPFDFREALHTVKRAEEQFELLPSKFRNELGNDPAQFLEFVKDPKNKERLIEMRLAKPKKESGMDLTQNTLSKLAEGISGALAAGGGKKPSPNQPDPKTAKPSKNA